MRGTRPKKTGRKYSGRAQVQFTKDVLQRWGPICHLCGLPGADSADHLVPRSIDPSLAFDIENARSAHARCNSSRGNRLPPVKVEAAGW